MRFCYVFFSAQDPDPGSAMEKMDSDPGHENFYNIF